MSTGALSRAYARKALETAKELAHDPQRLSVRLKLEESAMYVSTAFKLINDFIP